MRKKTLLSLCAGCRKPFLAFVLFLFSLAAKANTINAGDMAVIGMNALNDEVRVVTLVPLPAGTVIHFTDRGWSQISNSFHTFLSGDGTITWTVATFVSAGTVLRFYLGGTDAPTTLTNLTTGANLSANISINGFTGATDPLTIAGDQFYIYQDSDTNPYFIFAMNNSSGTVDGINWNTPPLTTLRDGMLPNGIGSQNALTNGVNAVGLPGGGLQMDNVQYNGPINLTNKGGWLSRFASAANWSGDNTGALTGTIANTTGAFVVLPIRLINFMAKAVANGSASLQWTIGANDEHSLFEIEHSVDGKNFTVIGTIQGTPSASEVTYRFTATNPGATNYYRLRYTDEKGVVGYSRTEAIAGRKGNLSLQVYPNPVSGSTITVAVQGTTAGSLPYQLLNSAGHRVAGGTLNNSVQQIGLGALPAGVYILQLGTGESVPFEKK